jgi:F0F1-type ATP synthase assembly protein I
VGIASAPGAGIASAPGVEVAWCITNAVPTMPKETPSPKPEPRKRSSAVDGIVKADQLLQIAFILPVSVVVGWAIGAGLDKWLHQDWIYLPGVVLGCVAGFVEMLRQVKKTEKDEK